MESGGQTDVIYTDFSKAFDSVNHSVLIAKLRLFGIHDPLLTWFSSYLDDKSQQVEINGFLSDIYQSLKVFPKAVIYHRCCFPFFYWISVIALNVVTNYCLLMI